jgi:hypothetical protein
MRNGLKVRLLKTVERNDVLRPGDFTFAGTADDDQITCRLVPSSLFAIGDREDGSVFETSNPLFGGMFGTRKHVSREGYQVTLRPGNVNESETFHARNDEDVVKHFGTWITSLEDEVNSYAEFQRLKEVEASVETLREQVEHLVEDVPFTRQEAEDIRQKLDALRGELDDEIKTQTGAIREELERTRKDVEALRGMVDGLSKRGFFKAVAARAAVAKVVNSPFGLKLLELAPTVFKLLTDSQHPGAGPT